MRWPRGSARDALHRSTHRRIRQPGAASVASKASTLADSSSTASSKCAISASIGSGSGDTGCTVMCISAAGTGAKNGKSSCPVAEATLAPTTFGSSTNGVTHVPPCDHSGSVSPQGSRKSLAFTTRSFGSPARCDHEQCSGSGKLVVVRKHSKAGGQDHHPGCSLATLGDDRMDWWRHCSASSHDALCWRSW